VVASQTAHFGGATFGNIIAGGIVGVVVDAASGANYSYNDDVRLDFAPTAPAVAQAAPVQLAPAIEMPVVFRGLPAS